MYEPELSAMNSVVINYDNYDLLGCANTHGLFFIPIYVCSKFSLHLLLGLVCLPEIPGVYVIDICICLVRPGLERQVKRDFGITCF